MRQPRLVSARHRRRGDRRNLAAPIRCPPPSSCPCQRKSTDRRLDLPDMLGRRSAAAPTTRTLLRMKRRAYDAMYSGEQVDIAPFDVARLARIGWAESFSCVTAAIRSMVSAWERTDRAVHAQHVAPRRSSQGRTFGRRAVQRVRPPPSSSARMARSEMLRRRRCRANLIQVAERSRMKRSTPPSTRPAPVRGSSRGPRRRRLAQARSDTQRRWRRPVGPSSAACLASSPPVR